MIDSIENGRWRSRSRMLLLVLTLLAGSMAMSPAAGAFGKGANGPDVFAVQGMLKSLGYFNGTVTGYFGSETEAGVKRFQQKYGLPVTGAVDDRTLESILWAYASVKIGKRTPPKQEPPTPQTPVPEQPQAPLQPQLPQTPQQPQAPDPDKSFPDEITAEEQQMIALVNEARRQAGLAPLVADAQLSDIARMKSRDMADNNYFSHQSPTYGSPFEMLQTFGISYSTAAENIACHQTVQGAHQALMQSQGHRDNILKPTFTRIGIGIVEGGQCGKLFTQLFMAE